MPAVTLTDHGSLAGAVELHREANKQGIKPIVGCEVYVADDRTEAGEGLRAPDRPRRVERGVREPDQALLARLPGGLLLQAARRLGAARAAREGARRPLRLPLRPRLEGARGVAAAGRRRRPRPARPDLRPRPDLRRDPERRPRAAAADQPAAREARRGDRPAARRDRRRPLPPPRGRARPRGAPLHPVGRLAEEPEPLEVRHRPVLFQDAGGDGPRLRRLRARDGADARGRRALQRDDRDRPPAAAEVPDAERPRRLRVPRRALRGRAEGALPDRSPTSSATACSSS